MPAPAIIHQFKITLLDTSPVIWRRIQVPDTYPRCVAGERACPPEDCGGTYSFQHMLEVLASPRDPEREQIMEWLGGKYEPEKFDPQAVKFSARRARRG
jgi:hypothetical protein